MDTKISGTSTVIEGKIMTLWQIGLLVFIFGGAVNAVFVHFGIGGILRELARLSVLTGLVILVIGLVKRKRTS